MAWRALYLCICFCFIGEREVLDELADVCWMDDILLLWQIEAREKRNFILNWYTRLS